MTAGKNDMLDKNSTDVGGVLNTHDFAYTSVGLMFMNEVILSTMHLHLFKNKSTRIK